MFEKRIQMCIELNILTTLFFYAEIENGDISTFYFENVQVRERRSATRLLCSFCFLSRLV